MTSFPLTHYSSIPISKTFIIVLGIYDGILQSCFDNLMKRKYQIHYHALATSGSARICCPIHTAWVVESIVYCTSAPFAQAASYVILQQQIIVLARLVTRFDLNGRIKCEGFLYIDFRHIVPCPFAHPPHPVFVFVADEFTVTGSDCLMLLYS